MIPGHIPNVITVNFDTAFIHIIKPTQQVDDRRFTCAGRDQLTQYFLLPESGS